MFLAVLDANVFVSAVISPAGAPAQILAAMQEEAFTLLMSDAILDELGRVLLYPKIRKRHGWSEDEVESFLKYLRRISISTSGELKLRVITEDPADNRYLECAVEGGADYIVSGDSHVLDLTEYEGIPIVNPQKFLIMLRTR